MQRRNSSLLTLHVVLSVLITLIVGCFGSSNSNRYRGKFRVHNLSKTKIYVADAVGFGHASPVCGFAAPGCDCSLDFNWLDSFPEKCTMKWTVVESGAEREQELSLTGVVPKGVEGAAIFTFDKDEQWSVRFEPKGD